MSGGADGVEREATLGALVISCKPERGGTWYGAVENKKRRWVPLTVKWTNVANSGNHELVALGARWLNGLDDGSIDRFLRGE